MLPDIPPVISEFSAAPLLAQVQSSPIAYYWHLPILIVVISLVYSATRFDDWKLIVREALRWARNLLMFLLGIGLVLYALSLWIP
jgi:hypothetical protein